MNTLPIYNKEGKETGTFELPEDVFAGKVNSALLHQAIEMYRASLRQGTVETKERAFVSGGGKKPYRQKGTGRARVGSIRSPLYRGGGTVFGPHPRDFGYSLPVKMKRAALRESLNAKYQSQDICCLDDLKDKFLKTKEFVKILTALKLRGKILALLEGCDESIRLVSRNIPRFEMLRFEDVNAYDILRNKKLLLTKSAFAKLLERLKK